MEAFSLLKYWRGGGGGGVFTRDATSSMRPTDSSTSSSATTTIVTAVSPSSSSSSDSDCGDDGPFFDLEFTLPEEDENSDSEDQIKDHKDLDPNFDQELENVNDKENEKELENDQEGNGEGEEIKFTLSSSSSGDSNEYDPNVTLSPSDDLFFKGHLVPIESSSILTDSGALPKFPSQVSSILKSSATKFRVHMLKFNKSKSILREKSAKSETNEKHENQERKQQNRVFTVKFKIEEVPLVSLFTRDTNKSIKRNASTNDNIAENTGLSGASGVMQRYLKKVKPLYIRVSKKYGDKVRFSGQLSFPKTGAHPPPPSEVKSPAEKCTVAKGGGAEGGEVAGEVVGESNIVKSSQKQGNLQAGLRVVCKHLGKSRSASLSLAADPAGAPAAQLVSKRRDDSLLQQHDGIQSAILHCKRSFNASRDLEASILSRSVSDPSHEKVAS